MAITGGAHLQTHPNQGGMQPCVSVELDSTTNYILILNTLAAHASMPHGQVFFHRVLRILSPQYILMAEEGKKGHQSCQLCRMMVSARIGTSACQPQVSLLKEKPAEWIQLIITFQTGKIQFILSVVFFLGFNSFMHTYIYICIIIFSSNLHPSAPAKTRSAAQRLKKQRVLRSQRGLPFSLSPMRTTSNSHSPVRERVSKEGNQIGKQPFAMSSW